MRKITFLMALLAVFWGGRIYSETVNLTSINENFNAGTLGTWGFTTSGTGTVFTNPVDNLNVLFKYPAGTAVKTLSSIVLPGEDNKVYIEFDWNVGTPGRTSNTAVLFFRDSSGRKIFGMLGYRLTGNSLRLLNLNVNFLNYDDTSIRFGTFALGANIHISAVLNYSTKKIETITASLVNNPATSVTANNLDFLNTLSDNIGDVYFEWSRGGSGDHTYLFDNFNIFTKYNVGIPSNPVSNSPQCVNEGVTLNSSDTPNSGETWYWQSSSTGTSTLNQSPFNTTVSGDYYLRSYRSDVGVWSSASSVVSVIVYPNSVGGTATATESVVPLNNGTTINLTGNTGTIQWYVSTNGTDYSVVSSGSGGTTATYTTPDLSSGTYYYKALVTSGSCSSQYSSVATVTSQASSAEITVGSMTGGNGSFGNVVNGSNSSSQSFTVSGAGLSTDITLVPPSGFEISTDNSNFINNSSSIVLTQSGGNVSSTAIYVRFSPVALQSYSGNISVASTGAITKYVSLSGKGIESEPLTQTSLASTSNVLHRTLTLSWTSGSGSKSLVLYSTNNNVATANLPVDGTTYIAGNTTAEGYVVGYVGSGTSVDFSALSPNTTYYFAVFSYSDGGVAASENYLISSPATANATTIIASNNTDYFRSRASGIWSSISTWESSINGTENWHLADIEPAADASLKLITAANPVTITTVISPTGFSMEDNATVVLKPGGATTYASQYDFSKSISGSGSSFKINIQTEAAAKNYSVNYAPAITNASTVNYEMGVAGRLYNSSVYWSTSFGGTIPDNSQFNITSTVGSAGFAINGDSKLTNIKVNLGDNIRVLKNYNANSGSPYSTIIIGELTGNSTSTIEGTWVSGRRLYYNIGGLNTDATFDGTFKNYAQTADYLYIVKKGTGNWTLTGNSSLFTQGEFTVDGGTVTLASGAAIGTVPVFVSGGANFVVNTGATLPSSITVNVNNTSVGKLNIPNGSTIANFTVGSTSAPEVGTTLNVFNTTDPSTIVYTNTPVVPAGYSYNTSTGVITYNGSTTSVVSDISTLALPTDATVQVSEASLNVDQNAKLRSLTLVPGTKLDIASGKTLTLASLKLESSYTNGTATFVNSGTAAITSANVQQHLTTGRNWYVSSPVTAATAATLLTGASKVYKYNEQTAGWVELASGDALLPGTGYITQATATGNVAFAGTLNDGNVQTTVSRLGTTKAGFNLVGNPYPSYLNWKACIEDADNVANAKVSTTVWYRTKTTGGAYTFATYNATSNLGTNVETLPTTDIVTGNIPPMQAFWVRVVDGQTAGTLTFKNAMRAHKGSQLQSDEQTRNDGKLRAPALNQVLRLQVSNGANSDEAIVLFNNSASNDLDMFDSYKMSNNSTSIPEIYTTVGNENLVINGLQAYDFNTVLPLGFRAGETNQYVISASQISNFDPDTKIYLLDNANGTQTDLTAGEVYAFTSDATTTDSRFSVLFKSAAGTTDLTQTNQNVKVYAVDNQIYVENSSVLKTVTAEVFNAVGQKVYSQLLNSDISQLSKDFASGAYVVKINDGAQAVAYKLIVR